MEDNEYIVITYSDWHRKGLKYQYVLTYNAPHMNGQVTVYWGIFTHHLVKWIHGKEAMKKMIFDRIKELEREVLSLYPKK